MVTIRDVAKHAGVSVATVSNALTENRSVNAETKKKVLRVARELNYSPNVMASSMVTKKTNIIGVFLYNFVEKNFLPYSEFLKGVTQKCQSSGQRVLVYTDVTEQQLRAGFVMGQEPMDAGIIFFPQEDEFRANDLKSACLPFVFVGRSKEFSFVDCENKKLTRNLAQKLISAGHRRICFFNSDKNWALTQDRHDGFLQALAENGIALRDCAEYFLEKNQDACKDLEDAFAAGFRAFMAESPNMVRCILKFCAARGLRIGPAGSLVFLGSGPRFEGVTPSLTCAKLSYEKLGEKALDLIEQIKEDKRTHCYFLDAEILEGESIARIGAGEESAAAG